MVSGLDWDEELNQQGVTMPDREKELLMMDAGQEVRNLSMNHIILDIESIEKVASHCSIPEFDKLLKYQHKKQECLESLDFVIGWLTELKHVLDGKPSQHIHHESKTSNWTN